MRERYIKIFLWIMTCTMLCLVVYMIFPTQSEELVLRLQAEAILCFDKNIAGRAGFSEGEGISELENNSGNSSGHSIEGSTADENTSITEIEAETEPETPAEAIAETEPETAVETLAEAETEPETAAADGAGNGEAGKYAEEAAEAAASVNQICILPESSLIPRITALCQGGVLTPELLIDGNYLLSKYFVVPGDTSLPADVLNAGILLSKDLSVEKNTALPVVLIYHTHSQEAYADSEPGNTDETVIGMGNLLEAELEARGYNVMHHTGIYDMTDGKIDRDPAYTKALPELTRLLAENPSIQVIIDLHRDGVAENVHLIKEINGVSMARFMLVNGLCRNADGERTDMTNVFREDNLAFALQTALVAETYYPGLFRTIYTRPKQYNQHLLSRSMLLEIGAQTNTVEEVRNAIPVITDILDKVLSQ